MIGRCPHVLMTRWHGKAGVCWFQQRLRVRLERDKLRLLLSISLSVFFFSGLWVREGGHEKAVHPWPRLFPCTNLTQSSFCLFLSRFCPGHYCYYDLFSFPPLGAVNMSPGEYTHLRTLYNMGAGMQVITNIHTIDRECWATGERTVMM